MPPQSPAVKRAAAATLAVMCIAVSTVLPAQSVTAFTAITLIDGRGGAPASNATLVVRDGGVLAAGPSARVTIPAGATRVALNGKTVIPGLVNAHGLSLIHISEPTRPY